MTMHPGKLDLTLYGTNRIGTPEYTDNGTWIRVDTYTSTISRLPVRERRFAAGKDDYSPMFVEGWNGKYDSHCSCCYLGFSHTTDEHAANLAEMDDSFKTILSILVQWDFKPANERERVIRAYFPEMPVDQRQKLAATTWSRLPVNINHALTFAAAKAGRQ